MHNWDYSDDSDYVVSYHKTYKGAYLAMRKWLLEKYERWFNEPKRDRHEKIMYATELYFIEKQEIEE